MKSVMALFTSLLVSIIPRKALCFHSFQVQNKPLFVPKNMISRGKGSALSMGLTLYGSSGSRSPLIDWAAFELDVKFDRGDLTKNPHPFGQIPCLVDDDDVTVFESGAILLYLFEKSSAKSNMSSKDKAAIMSWITWANASLDPICFIETPEGKVYDTGLKKPNKKIDQLNEILSNQKYLINDEDFTTADVAVGSYLLFVIQFFKEVNLLATRWPNILRYMKDCASREYFGKAFGSNVQNYCVETCDDMSNRSKDKNFFDVFKS